MVNPRIPETYLGIQGTSNVAVYDAFQRTMRDRGWIGTKAVIQTGIDKGAALEIGPGPGYLGLEWLKQTWGTSLTALEISPDMIALGRKNATAYELQDRWQVAEGSGETIPAEANRYDAVFSCRSLHEWEAPVETVAEILRVLKPGGLFFIGDLRRDIALPVKWFLWLSCKPRSIRPGLKASINAAYTKEEIQQLIGHIPIDNIKIAADPIGLTITGEKPC